MLIGLIVILQLQRGHSFPVGNDKYVLFSLYKCYNITIITIPYRVITSAIHFNRACYDFQC